MKGVIIKILVNNICIWIGQFKVDKKKHHIQNDREDVRFLRRYRITVSKICFENHAPSMLVKYDFEITDVFQNL